MKTTEKVIITCKELNRAYDKCQEVSRNGHLKDIPLFIWLGDTELEFTFDENLGSKGSWVLATKIEVTDDEEFYSEEEEL